MLSVALVSGQNSAHHAAEYARRHHGALAQGLRQSSDVPRRRYSASRCGLHKSDVGCARGGSEAAVKCDQCTRLIACADNKIGIIGVDHVLRCDMNCLIKCDVKKANRYFLILKQCLLSLYLSQA